MCAREHFCFLKNVLRKCERCNALCFTLGRLRCTTAFGYSRKWSDFHGNDRSLCCAVHCTQHQPSASSNATGERKCSIFTVKMLTNNFLRSHRHQKRSIIFIILFPFGWWLLQHLKMDSLQLLLTNYELFSFMMALNRPPNWRDAINRRQKSLRSNCWPFSVRAVLKTNFRFDLLLFCVPNRRST